MIMHKRYRYVSRWAGNKERMAALPIGASVLAGSIAEGDCLRYAAKQMGRRVCVYAVAKGQPLQRVTRTA